MLKTIFNCYPSSFYWIKKKILELCNLAKFIHFLSNRFITLQLTFLRRWKANKENEWLMEEREKNNKLDERLWYKKIWLVIEAHFFLLFFSQYLCSSLEPSHASKIFPWIPCFLHTTFSAPKVSDITFWRRKLSINKLRLLITCVHTQNIIYDVAFRHLRCWLMHKILKAAVPRGKVFWVAREEQKWHGSYSEEEQILMIINNTGGDEGAETSTKYTSSDWRDCRVIKNLEAVWYNR